MAMGKRGMQHLVSLMTRAVFRRSIAGCACAALLLCRALPSVAEPAMWVVKDEDSTIYLLGTFHATKPGMEWRSEKIDAAFKASDELWLEATVDENAPELRASVLK